MARPDPGPDMKRLADEFVGLMRELDWQLDYSEQSVQTVEEMIERQFADWRPWRSGKVGKKNFPVASLVGAYLGEVMIRNVGGRGDGCRSSTSLPSNSPPESGRHRPRRPRSDSSTARKTISPSTTRH